MDRRSNEKQRGRRLVSLLLSLVMTVQLLPALVTEADAAELSAGQHFSVDMHAARVRATVDGVDERK